MAHGTRVNNTAYGISGGKCLVNGTAYSIKKGRTLVGGTGYDISFGKQTEVFVSIANGFGGIAGYVEIAGKMYMAGTQERLIFPVGETVLIYVESPMNGIKVNNSTISYLPFKQDITGKYCEIYYGGELLDPIEITIE